MRDQFAVYESSGLWDAPVAAWKANADRCQKSKVGGVPVSLGIHTEATRDKVVAAFKHQPGNWGFERMDRGSEEIVLTYDRDLWALVGSRDVQVSKTLIYTKHGNKQPLTHMLEAKMDFRPTGRRVYVQGLHWALRNTPARARAWAEMREKVQRRWARILTEDPDALIVHLGDLNEDMRKPVERHRVLDVVAGTPGMHQTWQVGNLPARGTHGTQLIDNCLTNAKILKGGAVLLSKTPAFDHRPMGALLRAPALN